MRAGADHFDELGILHHHCMNDTKEALIGRENSNAASQGITLHESLTHVFTENFNYTAAACIGKFVPLEVAVRRIEYCIKFVTLQLIRREQPHTSWVVLECLVDEAANCFHGTFAGALLCAEGSPIRQVGGNITIVTLDALAKLLCIVSGDHRFDLVYYITV